ncbi:hypothetical protein [Saliphagus sp. LR7]|uniref:hypothetical protein n=1 Tax=Saliphagus sp. LR7 TaxID=2282654 RepID=UPI0018E57A20|nr:hypothetical protein [Saliphagus sp. LR7]
MPSLLERLLGTETPDEQVDLEARQNTADETLGDLLAPGDSGVEDCGVTGVAVVNEGPDGEPVVVPIVRFSLGEDVETPDMDLVWELVGTAIDAVEAADDIDDEIAPVAWGECTDYLSTARESRRSRRA